MLTGLTGVDTHTVTCAPECWRGCWRGWHTCREHRGAVRLARLQPSGPSGALGPDGRPCTAGQDGLWVSSSRPCSGGGLTSCPLCPSCPGAHPECHVGRRGGRGHSRRDDAHALWLPHRRLHLWHRLHPGFCVPDGEGPRQGAGGCSMLGSVIPDCGGASKEERGLENPGSPCIGDLQNPGSPHPCHSRWPEQHPSPLSSHSWSPAYGSRTLAASTTCTAFPVS